MAKKNAVCRGSAPASENRVRRREKSEQRNNCLITSNLPCTRHFVSIFQYEISFSSLATPVTKELLSYFTNEEMEAQRERVNSNGGSGMSTYLLTLCLLIVSLNLLKLSFLLDDKGRTFLLPEVEVEGGGL